MTPCTVSSEGGSSFEAQYGLGESERAELPLQLFCLPLVAARHSDDQNERRLIPKRLNDCREMFVISFARR